MVLQLLVQDWLRHGSESLALSVRSMTENLGRAEHVGGAHHAILDRLLRDLPSTALMTLNIASILGSRLNDLSLYSSADLSASQVLMGMAELTRRHILRDSPSGLDFTNELIRSQTYSQMPRTLRRAVHAAIADALLGRGGGGQDSDNELETAWHLVRGGRPAAAAPHLLNGARAAIRTGAPHEAELALSSALQGSTILDSASRNDATLLLAEIQQEQSRWRDSAHALINLHGPLSPHQADQAALLGIVAKRHTEHLGGGQLPRVIGELLHLHSHASSTRVKLRALSVASGILDQTQGPDHVDTLWAAADRFRGMPLPAEEEADLRTAQAFLHYHARDTIASLENVNKAIALLEESGVGNASFATLVLGLSALACSEGRYADAVTLGQRGFALATRLDNERIALRAGGNVSLAYGRLGEYRLQLEWAQRRAALLRRGTFDQEKLLTALFTSSAKAMLRDATAIDEIHAAVESLSNDQLPWVQQSTDLLYADAYKLLGKSARALDCGRRATHGDNYELHSISFAGRYARWVAATLTGGTAERPREAEPRLAGLVANRNRYDTIDRIEIIAAYLATAPHRGPLELSLAIEAKNMLARLPAAVSDQLELLGSLAALGGSEL